VTQDVERVREVAGMDDQLSAYVESDRARLVGLAYLFLANSSDAEDAVHSALARLAGKDLGHVADLPSYVRRTVVNECSSWKRSQVRRRQAEERVEAFEAAPDLIGALDLAGALQRLSAQHRAAVVLRYYLDLDDSAIAEVLDCAPATVRSRLSRALRKLRSELGDG
jgi:RNA polymerase sigma factor (sigma-70 family)